MYERLLEGWLDSASERSYQGPFCQVLAAQGYAVLHSTRHAPIEFGKDVIAVAPDGVPCAYQLKGNPGSRLTHAQYREIAPQLFELATQSIVFPGRPPGPHRSYLVTNGNVDEEVQRAIDDMNRNFAERGSRSHKTAHPDHRFRRMPITQNGGCRSPIPGHRDRTKRRIAIT